VNSGQGLGDLQRGGLQESGENLGALVKIWAMRKREGGRWRQDRPL
jgi:hypothetical protein